MSSLSLSTVLEYEKVSYENPNRVRLLIRLKGDRWMPETRNPLAIGVAIDCSGSMSWDGGLKMDYAKKSLLKLIDHMTEEDTLGIVGFSNSVFTVLAPTRMDEKAKERARIEVEKLGPISATNLSGAALSSFDLVRDSSAQVKRCLLFTDGRPTCGEMNPEALIAIAKQSPNGVGLTTFGYGTDHDPELLSAMAKAGGGNFYLVENPDQAPGFFGREIGGLLSCVAQNIKVHITPAPGVEIVKVLNDLDVEDASGAATISVDDVYSEETRSILVELNLPQKNKAVAVRASKLIDIQINFHDLRAGEARGEGKSVMIEYVKSKEADQNANKDVLEQVALIEAAEAQVKAMELADKGDFKGARHIIMSAVGVMKGIDTKLCRSVAKDLKDNVLGRVSADSWEKTGGHIYMFANAAAYGTGRGATVGTSSMFDTQAQKDTASDYDRDDASPIVDSAGDPVIKQVKPEKSDKDNPVNLSKRRKKRN